MSFTLSRVAGLAALTCAASALALPLAAPASATPVEKVFVVADTDGDNFGQGGLYLTAGGGIEKAVVPETDLVDVFDLSSSADGSRVAYVQDNYSAAGDPISEQVIVRDVSTRLVRVLETIALDDTRSLGSPQLSPDGTKAVWERATYTTTPVGLEVRKADVTSGAATTVKTGYSPYAFVSASTLLVQNLQGTAFTVPYAGGAATAATGVPADAFQVTVSPDALHPKLAWALFQGSTASSIQVADYALSNGALTASGVTTVANGGANTEPSFSRDATNVLFVHTASGVGEVWQVPTAGGTAGAITSAPTNETDVAVVESDGGVLPGAVTPNPAVLKGTQATLSWTQPADNDLSAIVVTYAQQGSATTKTAYVTAPTSTWTVSGLTLGATYTFALQTLDRSGNKSATSPTVILVALQALPTFSDPTSSSSTTASFPVSFGPATAPGALFYAKWGTVNVPWTDWVKGDAARVRTFGAPAVGDGSVVAATTSTAGSSYTFQARITDGHGNSTPWVNSARAVVPFDQTAASYSGGGTAADTSSYFGSYRKLWHKTDVARITLTGNRLTVVGLRCSTCGLFDVFENGSWIGTVNGYSAATQERQVLFTKTYSTIGTHSYAIRSRSVPGRLDAKLDGFAMRT